MKKEKQNYAEMLKDPRWKRKSKEIKEWDRNVCQLCGDNSNLQVHHLCYDKGKEPWDYPRRALVTLCSNCHQRTHEYDKQFNNNFNNLVVKLGKNGVSKATILMILEYVLKQSVRYDDNNIFDELWCIPYSHPYLVFGREYRNDIFQKEKQRDKEFLEIAKKAYEWNTGNKDFSEESAFAGEYYDDIIEYKREFELD